MRVSLPTFESKAKLFDYLKSNKKQLISNKKATPITSEALAISMLGTKKEAANKANTPVSEDLDTLRVKVVANTANFLDSHFDLLLPDAAKESIKQRKNFIPHLHDHKHDIAAKVGEVVDISLESLSFEDLGLKGLGFTQAIVFTTDIKKSYNEQIFNQYKAGRVNQHSIGLQYVNLELAINDQDSPEELAVWNKYISQVINKDLAEQAGFFWAVKEIKLIENSAVLFGANEITPTLDNNIKDFGPLDSTQETAPQDSTQTETIKNYLLNN
jgi:hypothetical protein